MSPAQYTAWRQADCGHLNLMERRYGDAASPFQDHRLRRHSMRQQPS